MEDGGEGVFLNAYRWLVSFGAHFFECSQKKSPGRSEQPRLKARMQPSGLQDLEEAGGPTCHALRAPLAASRLETCVRR